MHKTSPFLLVALGMAVAGCAAESGIGSNDYGASARQNEILQAAYGDPSRLQDLSVAFRAAASDTVNFDFNSAVLDDEARGILRQQAMWLNANAAIRMAVIGHTDLVGGEAYNNRLGLRRARAAVNYLVSQGVDRSRLDAVESRGERDPVVNTPERERRNRRSVTVVAGFTEGLVGTGIIDGRYADRIITENYIRGDQGTKVPVGAGILDDIEDVADVSGE